MKKRIIKIKPGEEVEIQIEEDKTPRFDYDLDIPQSWDGIRCSEEDDYLEQWD